MTALAEAFCILKGVVIISTFSLGEIANTNYKSNKELDFFLLLI